MNRLEEVDVDDFRKRGARYAEVARKSATKGAKVAGQKLATRVRPRPKRRVPIPVIGVLVVGAAAGVGYLLLQDRRRRDAITGRVTQLQKGAQQRYAELGGVTGAVDKVRTRVGGPVPELDEAALEQKVREVVAEAGKPVSGLKVTVEGRTVYLRGAVDDPGTVDGVAERVHGVDGVVAVVNLTTTPARATAGNSKKSSS
jgi:osmotically-inducible protein OsmY